MVQGAGGELDLKSSSLHGKPLADRAVALVPDTVFFAPTCALRALTLLVVLFLYQSVNFLRLGIYLTHLWTVLAD